MEQITYRKTLDVHKNGIQFLLQGFETADILSRVIEISLMASGDAIDFPLERVVAMMYVTTPNATEPSINRCTIKDNKVVYDVLPIVEEGITTMQIKIIETSTDGATSVIASPKFAVEVTKSGADDGSAEQTTTFTALEDAVAKAKTVYDERFLRMELTNDCVFKAYYADGTEYETDILKKLFHNGNVLLSESYAHGGTGTRIGEDTDNSLYYSNVSKSEALNAKDIMANSEEILEEVKLHGVYTAFSVDFETGEVEYVSPSFKFNVNIETGELDAIGQSYSFNEEVFRVVDDWLASRNIFLSDLQAIATTHSAEILNLDAKIDAEIDSVESAISMFSHDLSETTQDVDLLKTRVAPIELGGTGANNALDAQENLGLGWFTLGSTHISSEIPDEEQSHKILVTNGQIPVDKDILKGYNHFRYVIKQGSTIYAEAPTYTHGVTGKYSITAKCIIADVGIVDASIYYNLTSNNPVSENTINDYVFTEDTLIRAGYNQISEYVSISNGILNKTQENLPSTNLQIQLSRAINSASGDYFSKAKAGIARMALTVELQGRL